MLPFRYLNPRDGTRSRSQPIESHRRANDGGETGVSRNETGKRFAERLSRSPALRGEAIPLTRAERPKGAKARFFMNVFAARRERIERRAC